MMLEDIKSVAEQRHMGHDCIYSVYSLNDRRLALQPGLAI